MEVNELQTERTTRRLNKTDGRSVIKINKPLAKLSMRKRDTQVRDVEGEVTTEFDKI